MKEAPRRTIVTQTNWTREELIPHIRRRAANGISDAELARDIGTATTVIKIQATHIAESGAAVREELERLNTSLREKGYCNLP